MAQRTNEEPVRPVHTVRYGAIKAGVWKNPTKNGAMYNVTISRSYRTDDQWHDSNSFGYDDLLVIGKALDDAHTWIHAAIVEDAQRERQDKPDRQSESSPSTDNDSRSATHVDAATDGSSPSANGTEGQPDRRSGPRR